MFAVFRHNKSGKNFFTTRTSGKLFRFDRVLEWTMHLIKSSYKEDAFVHSKTLFVKSKIICKQFTSLKSFATDRKVTSHGSHKDVPFSL